MSQKRTTRRDLLKNISKLSMIGATSSALLTNHALGQTIYNPNVTQLTQYVVGSLPILIVAPHGGTELVNGIASRRNVNKPVSNFSYYGAVWTYEICLQIRRTLERLSGGKKPYMVLNLAHRRYVDVNREEAEAYEVVLNAPRIYWEYHDFITEYTNRMNVLFSNPILIEITGQSDNPDIIQRRTLNGQTVERMVTRHGQKLYNEKLKKLEEDYEFIKNTPYADKFQKLLEQFKSEASRTEFIKKHGHESYTGEESLVGELEKRGYKINPRLGEPELEQALTIAGNYTLETYGRNSDNRVNAIQLVIGSEYRRSNNYLQTGRDIGNAIWAFAKRYIIDTNDITED